MPHQPIEPRCRPGPRLDDLESRSSEQGIEVCRGPILEPPGRAVALGFPLGPSARFDRDVKQTAGAQNTTDFPQRRSRFVGREMEKGSVGPGSGQAAIPNRQTARVGLNPRPWELPQASPQHSEGEVERNRPQPQAPKRRRVATWPGSEIEDRAAGADTFRETPEPQRNRRAIPGVLEEAPGDLVVRLAGAIDSIAHLISPLTSPRAMLSADVDLAGAGSSYQQEVMRPRSREETKRCASWCW